MRRLLIVVLLCAGVGGAGEGVVHYDLKVKLDPKAHAIEVAVSEGGLRFFIDDKGEYFARFRLNAGLDGPEAGPGLVVRRLDEVKDGPVPLRGYLIAPREAGNEKVAVNGGEARGTKFIPVAYRYKGTIHHPLETQAEEYARSFSETPGTISEEGVFLSGASGWYPVAGDEMVTFTLEIDLPKDWDAVSEGVRTRHEVVGDRRIVT